MTYRLKNPATASPGEHRLTDAALATIRAAAMAAQLAADRAAVTAAAGSILDTVAVLGVDGTLDSGLLPPTPTGADPVLDLADLLVARLYALAVSLGTGGEPAFSVSWKSDPVAELSDAVILSPVAWVTDFGAVSYTADSSSVGLEEFELLVILQRKIAADETADTVCRAMSALAAEIAAYCRRTILDPGDAGNGAACFKVDRDRVRDFKEWHEADLYRVEISTRWRRARVDDEEGD